MEKHIKNWDDDRLFTPERIESIPFTPEVNQLRPFVRPAKNFGMDEVMTLIQKTVNNERENNKYKEIVQQLANLGIHSPAKDPAINHFNALVQKARTALLSSLTH